MVAILTLLADAGKGGGGGGGGKGGGFAGGGCRGCGGVRGFGACVSGFLRFRGGRGVATTLGVFFCWELWIGGAAVAVWLAVFVVSRFSSLASLVAAPTATVLFAFWGESPVVAVAAGVMSALVVFRHRENIDRLLRGEENRFGSPTVMRRMVRRAAAMSSAIIPQPPLIFRSSQLMGKGFSVSSRRKRMKAVSCQ